MQMARMKHLHCDHSRPRAAFLRVLQLRVPCFCLALPAALPAVAFFALITLVDAAASASLFMPSQPMPSTHRVKPGRSGPLPASELSTGRKHQVCPGPRDRPRLSSRQHAPYPCFRGFRCSSRAARRCEGIWSVERDGRVGLV